jgi:hypothetical protein
MIVRGERDGVVLVPETEWEIEQLARLDRPGMRFQIERVDRQGSDPYPRHFLPGDALKIQIPEHRWGT